MARIAALYRPYHQALRDLIERAAAIFGVAVLLDCHSMPSSVADGAAPDFVIGDRYGASAAPWIVDTVENALRRAGYSVRRNKPYAGGFITEHYGAPAAGAPCRADRDQPRALYGRAGDGASERWREVERRPVRDGFAAGEPNRRRKRAPADGGRISRKSRCLF